MVDGCFAQGTTPTQVFDVPSCFNTDDYFITYVQSRPYVKITKKKEECKLKLDEKLGLKFIGTTLKPEESSRFQAGAIIDVQLTIVTSSGEVLVSEPCRVRIEKGLHTMLEE